MRPASAGARWLGALLLAAGAAGPAAAGAGDPAKAGAYCPLPPPGQTPRCLDPAKAQYGDFFASLEQGVPAEAAAAPLEADLAAGGGPRAYLALSSLAYAYWQLSERAAASSHDAAVAQRLERWNALLREAYAASGDDPGYRAALREAALDLRRRAPPVQVRCVDESGNTTECSSTEAVLRGVDATADEVGLRGALGRLLARLFGDEGAESP